MDLKRQMASGREKIAYEELQGRQELEVSWGTCATSGQLRRKRFSARLLTPSCSKRLSDLFKQSYNRSQALHLHWKNLICLAFQEEKKFIHRFAGPDQVNSVLLPDCLFLFFETKYMGCNTFPGLRCTDYTGWLHTIAVWGLVWKSDSSA